MKACEAVSRKSALAGPRIRSGEGGGGRPDLLHRGFVSGIPGQQSSLQRTRHDAGVIFGTGFAPYTGGPMNFLHTGEH